MSIEIGEKIEAMSQLCALVLMAIEIMLLIGWCRMRLEMKVHRDLHALTLMVR